jgi:hypothetical protein
MSPAVKYSDTTVTRLTRSADDPFMDVNEKPGARAGRIANIDLSCNA